MSELAEKPLITRGAPLERIYYCASRAEGLKPDRHEIRMQSQFLLLGVIWLPPALAMAELERENLRERTKAGLQAAKRRGVRLGRPPALTPEQLNHAKALYAGGNGMKKADIARNMGVDYSTLRRALR